MPQKPVEAEEPDNEPTEYTTEQYVDGLQDPDVDDEEAMEGEQ